MMKMMRMRMNLMMIRIYVIWFYSDSCNRAHSLLCVLDCLSMELRF